MDANELVLAKGLRETRGTFERWNEDPWPVLRDWIAGALAVTVAMLLGVLAVATLTTADYTTPYLPGVGDSSDLGDLVPILWQNSLVLALHATACVAGFMAGSVMPLQAERRRGLSRWVHEKARPVALGWVVLVTGFSLLTQTYALGLTADQAAHTLGVSPATLLLTVLPHAVPELVALFLPLAAWTIASRRDQWGDLLAATFATVALAVPVLVATALWEVFAWPRLLEAVSPGI